MPFPALVLTVDGTPKPIAQWSAETGVPVTTIHSRVRLGWSHADAVRVPADRRFRPAPRATTAAATRPAPKLRTHKASGRAYAEWVADRKRHVVYFGKARTPDADGAYARFVLEWATARAGVGTSGTAAGPADGLLVGELIRARLDFCEDAEDGCGKRGKPTSELHARRAALNYVLPLRAGAHRAQSDARGAARPRRYTCARNTGGDSRTGTPTPALLPTQRPNVARGAKH